MLAEKKEETPPLGEKRISRLKATRAEQRELVNHELGLKGNVDLIAG